MVLHFPLFLQVLDKSYNFFHENKSQKQRMFDRLPFRWVRRVSFAVSNRPFSRVGQLDEDDAKSGKEA